MNVGDVLTYSWGYEQTNISFYQVTRVTAKFAWIRRIEAAITYTARTLPDGTVVQDSMTGECTPVVGAFVQSTKEQRRMIQTYDGKTYLRMPHGIANMWDGQPEHWTAYA